MPDRRFYPWRVPPSRLDRILAHPMVLAISTGGIIAGIGMILSALGLVGLTSTETELPATLHAGIGVALALGSIITISATLHSWRVISRGWSLERFGLMLQVAGLASYASSVLYVSPHAVTTWALTAATGFGFALRFLEIRAIERHTRALIAEGRACE